MKLHFVPVVSSSNVSVLAVARGPDVPYADAAVTSRGWRTVYDSAGRGEAWWSLGLLQ